MIFRHPKTEFLSRSLDGELGPGTRAALERHLTACADCRASLSGLAQARATLSGLPPVESGTVPPPPHFIPVVRPTFSPWTLATGAILGMLLLGVIALRPTHAPMKVVSSNPPGLSAEGVVDRELQPGMAMKTLKPGPVDLEIPNQILLRLKPGTTITWQQVNPPLRFFSRPQVVVNLMRGEMLARTKEGFWGSQFEIRTPNANATVKGTAFSMEVEPEQDATLLKVLAGNVFFSSYLGKVGVNVESGQSSRILSDRLPPETETLSAEERSTLLETYQIGKEPSLALVIGAGPERIQEFLKPALLYVSEKSSSKLQPLIHKSVKILNERLLAGEAAYRDWDLGIQAKHLKVLERVLENTDDAEVEVPLRLYVAAYESYLGYPRRASLHLRMVTEKFPKHPLAPLAIAAVGIIAQEELNDFLVALEAFRYLAEEYPNSAEAILAREYIGE